MPETAPKLIQKILEYKRENFIVLKKDKISYIQANRDHRNKNLPLYEKQIKFLSPFTFLQLYILFSSLLASDYWGVHCYFLKCP